MTLLQLGLDNRVRLPLGAGGVETLTERQRGELTELFTHKNPKRSAMKAMGIRGWWAEPETERTWEVTRARSSPDKVLTFPRGGFERVCDYLDAQQVPYEFDDRRCDGAPDLRDALPPYRVELRDYQRAALDAAVDAVTGLIRAPTGSGKSEVALAIAAEVRVGTCVLVNTRELLDQWVKRAQKSFGLRERDVGVVQGSLRTVKPITVAMQQSLHRQGADQDFLRSFGAVIYDEVQLAAASSFYEVVDQFPARYRIGVSADEGRKDKKEYLTYDLFGDVVYEIGREALIDQGHVLDVEVVVVPTEFEADWYGVGDGSEIDFARLSDEMTQDEARTQLGVEKVLEAVRDGGLVFVMTRRREHCQRVAAALVARGCPAGFLIGGDDYRSEFQATKQAMLEGRLRVGVGTVQSIGTGIDFPAVDTVVVMTPFAGNKQMVNQVRGRVCRKSKGKARARLYYLWDQRCSYGAQHLKNLVAWNRTVTVLGANATDGKSYLRLQRQRRRNW
jgi:superfamily II DNA or RNA helicase